MPVVFNRETADPGMDLLHCIVEGDVMGTLKRTVVVRSDMLGRHVRFDHVGSHCQGEVKEVLDDGHLMVKATMVDHNGGHSMARCGDTIKVHTAAGRLAEE